MKLSGIRTIKLVAIKSPNLDTLCYRGSAPIGHLAMISQPDVFDQEKNPNGLQRDLSAKHASDAYEYVHRKKRPNYPRAYPEIVLNVRDQRCLDLSPQGKTVAMTFDLDAMVGPKVHVSRVDGNHRLFHADGDDRREPLLLEVPFQIHVGLSREQERSLFVDINSNQKGMNTSHLAVMQSRLTREEEEIKNHLDRWIAKKLSEDAESPWHGLIHMGGSREGSRVQGLNRVVNFASLQSGVHKLLSKSQYIHDLTDAEVQYVVIRNYWHAVKKIFEAEWANPREYLVLKNIGVLSLSILGGTIIDRCMPQGKVEIPDMARYLKQSRNTFNWSRKATGDNAISGMSGNRAALIIAGAMAEELTEEGGRNIFKDLQERLRAKM
jgi:DGQHR domain-containing protein